MNERNIYWQNSKITYDDRRSLMGHGGIVVWLTGLSGSGKTTIATDVEKTLYERGIKTYLLDGDNIRHGLNTDLGFTDSDRNENIRRIAEVAKLFRDACFVTLVSFISPFAQARVLAKQVIGVEFFIEVYVKANIGTCIERNPKGLYKKNIPDFTGISSAYEPPVDPDLILDTELLSVAEASTKLSCVIIERLEAGS